MTPSPAEDALRAADALAQLVGDEASHDPMCEFVFVPLWECRCWSTRIDAALKTYQLARRNVQ